MKDVIQSIVNTIKKDYPEVLITEVMEVIADHDNQILDEVVKELKEAGIKVVDK